MIASEKQLIGRIRELRQIKPGKDWVSFNKTRILGEEPKTIFFPYFKPAFAGLVTVFVFFGAFVSAQNSLPGDLLYPIKKIVEKSQAIFVSAEEKPAFQLKIANERLEDLTKASVKNLAPTINEFQANVSEAARNLVKIDADASSPVLIKKIVEETKKIEENKQKAESFGVVVGEEGTNELKNALGKIVENLIQDTEEGTLTEEKTEVLSKMKELSGEEKYSEALELYLINQ
jgi:hypothetical protein